MLVTTKKNNKKGFTLSEVLIALTILGLIAATMIPTIISITSKTQYVNGLKKANLILKTATSQLMAENGGTMVGLVATNADVTNYLNKYCTKLNCIKKCNTNSVDNGCFASGAKSLNGDYAMLSPNRPGAILSNGMTMFISAENISTCTSMGVTENGDNVGCASIYIDVNGFKQPNRLGRDIFNLNVYRKGVVPYGTNINSDNAKTMSDWGVFCDTSYAGGSGGQCAGRILYEGKMNY